MNDEYACSTVIITNNHVYISDVRRYPHTAPLMKGIKVYTKIVTVVYLMTVSCVLYATDYKNV